jgi:hypothetical protein
LRLNRFSQHFFSSLAISYSKQVKESRRRSFDVLKSVMQF